MRLIYWLVKGLKASQEGLCSTELVYKKTDVFLLFSIIFAARYKPLNTNISKGAWFGMQNEKYPAVINSRCQDLKAASLFNSYALYILTL
jgi:hypothetical protein